MSSTSSQLMVCNCISRCCISRCWDMRSLSARSTGICKTEPQQKRQVLWWGGKVRANTREQAHWQNCKWRILFVLKYFRWIHVGQDSIFQGKTIWYSINQIIVENNYEAYYQQQGKLLCQESHLPRSDGQRSCNGEHCPLKSPFETLTQHCWDTASLAVVCFTQAHLTRLQKLRANSVSERSVKRIWQKFKNIFEKEGNSH